MEAAATEWEKTNLVFTNAKGGFLSYRTVYDCFKRIVKKMGCPELRFHDLRHQYAVIAIKNGDDIKTIQGNLGHATAAFTLDVYGRLTSFFRYVKIRKNAKRGNDNGFQQCGFSVCFYAYCLGGVLSYKGKSAELLVISG
jgi:integrase